MTSWWLWIRAGRAHPRLWALWVPSSIPHLPGHWTCTAFHCAWASVLLTWLRQSLKISHLTSPPWLFGHCFPSESQPHLPSFQLADLASLMAYRDFWITPGHISVRETQKLYHSHVRCPVDCRPIRIQLWLPHATVGPSGVAFSS